MSMSTHITGIRDLDGKFATMLAAKLTCERASVSYPQELRDYFGGEVGESEEYLRRKMETVDISKTICKPNRTESEIYEVDLSKLPKDVKALRFENSW